MVGEAGAELVEQGGRMYVVDKPQVIWLNPTDKVYNPKETREMMYTPDRSVAAGIQFDYERLGKEVGKNIPQFGLNIDENGLREWTMNGHNYTIYLNRRRGL